MGIKAYFKGSKAIKLHKKGENGAAKRLYEEAFAEGLNDPRFLLPYALLIIREGQYQEAKEFLVKHQKAPGMTPNQRVELMVYYAVCCFRLNNVDKGIDTLEQQFRKTQTGLIYQTLGYLYVEKYDLSRKPDFAAVAAAAAEPETAEATETQETPADAAEAPAEEGAEAEKKRTPKEEWKAGVEKAEAFILQSVDYDDEDPICLDNMGQFIYRVKGDKTGARQWFDKAIALKDTQIDTLWYLSRYDLDNGDEKAAVEKLEKAAEGRFSPLNYCDRDMVKQEIARLKGEH